MTLALEVPEPISREDFIKGDESLHKPRYLMAWTMTIEWFEGKAAKEIKSLHPGVMNNRSWLGRMKTGKEALELEK